MIYIDSKGKEVPIEKLDDFHLANAHRKIQSMRNHLGGYAGADGQVARYVEIVRVNLWNEMVRRSEIKSLRKNP